MDIYGIHIDDAIIPHKHAMDGLVASQQAVSNNVANASTPGYVAQHVDFASYLDAGSNPFETRLSVAMGPSMAPGLMAPQSGQVSLQDELMISQDNMLRFGIVTQHMGKVFTRLKEATNIGR